MSARPPKPRRSSTTSAHRSRRPGRLGVTAAAAALVLATLSACGDGTAEAGADPSAGTGSTVTVEDPWVRATTGTEDPSMTGAFMVLDNQGDSEVTVTGARSEVAGRTELHEMAMVDGEMVMRETEGGITLAPGRGQVLQPGGVHVMLMGLEQELSPGDEVEVTLLLDDGTEVGLTAPVKEFTEEEGHYHEPGTDPDHGHGEDEGSDG